MYITHQVPEGLVNGNSVFLITALLVCGLGVVKRKEFGGEKMWRVFGQFSEELRTNSIIHLVFFLSK